MIDHFVYATAGLHEAVARLAEACGVALADGGAHEGLGTRNHLLALGPHTYLEVIGPDPDQPASEGPRPFGIDTLAGDGIASWCVRPRLDLAATRHALADVGVDCTEPLPMSRRRVDGVLLEWEVMWPLGGLDAEGFPFFIDWGDSPHPADGLAQAVVLAELNVRTPRPEQLTAALALSLGADEPVYVAAGDTHLTATLTTPLGEIELSDP